MNNPTEPRPPRLMDTATVKANHQRFMKRIIDSETVWYLAEENGCAHVLSNDEEAEGTPVLLFWSDEAYARRAQQAEFDDCALKTIELFDFLYRWLPGMSEDEVLAGANFTDDLIGMESDPYELRCDIEGMLPETLVNSYQAKYEELSG